VVDVHDPEIGSGEKIVVGYEYSLLDATSEKMTSVVSLGRLAEERIPPDREVFEIDSMAFASNVMTFLQDNFFGGDIKDLEEDLLKQAKVEEIECYDRKTLHKVVDVLRDIVDENRARPTIDAHDSVEFRSYDPMGKISAKRKQFLPLVQTFFEAYVDVTLGGSGTRIVNRINDIYEDFFPENLADHWPPYEPAEVEEEPGAEEEKLLYDAEEIWGSDFNEYEIEVAQAILDYAVATVGDIKKIHEGLGGGKDGLIPAINELHRLFTEWSNRVAGRFSHTIMRFLEQKITGGSISDLSDPLIYLTDTEDKRTLEASVFPAE